MDDESISTPEAIGGQEGSIETLENATLEYLDEPKLVPERDLLAVKDKAQRKDNELREARARIKELEQERPKQSSPDLETLKAKYEGVDSSFIEDMVSIARKQAQDELAPLLSQQKKSAFDKQFDELYDRHLAKAENVDTSKVDKEVIKALTLSPQYRGVPPKDIIEKLYKVEPTGRATTENDMRPAMDLKKGSFDVDTLSKEEVDRNWGNPEFRKAYIEKKYT